MMYDFGLLLKQLRENKGLTQAQLASKINRTKTVISKYENNLQTPTIDTLIELSVIFNVSLDYLAGIDMKKAISLNGLTSNQVNIILNLAERFNETPPPNVKGLSPQQLELINQILIEFTK